MQIVKGWGVEECPGNIIFVYNTNIYTFICVSSLLLKKKCNRFLGHVLTMWFGNMLLLLCVVTEVVTLLIVITFHSFTHAHCA